MTRNPFDSLLRQVYSVNMDRRRHWYVFRAFNVYRLVLVAVLLCLYWFNGSALLAGSEPVSAQATSGVNRTLFLASAAGYLALILLALIGSWRRLPVLSLQATGQTLVDIVALCLLGIAASAGGLSALLMIISLATAGLLLSTGRTLLLALCAGLALLIQQLYFRWQQFSVDNEPANLSFANIVTLLDRTVIDLGPVTLIVTGICLISAVLITALFAKQAKQSDQSAGQQLQELLELAQLNQAIVQHAPFGMVVVDKFARVQLINEAARHQLSFSAPAEGLLLNEISPLLSQRLATWISVGLNNPRPFRPQEHLPDITPTFSALGERSTADGSTLILLEDSARIGQRLQQIKLVALGRLTASIAHEVRNPLASVSHAAQLLKESETANSADKRLATIVHDNAKRAGNIIAHVLDLSRRDKAKPEEFLLLPWLQEFRQEFLRGYSEPIPEIDLRVRPRELVVRFDPNHLQQVLWNLFTNACTHGTAKDQTPLVKIDARLDVSPGGSNHPVLDVIDFGPGIPELESQRVFEPFFTTQVQGTGLGLYVSRDICEANRGQLQYIRLERGSCFRITFPTISKLEKQAVSALRKSKTVQH